MQRGWVKWTDIVTHEPDNPELYVEVLYPAITLPEVPWRAIEDGKDPDFKLIEFDNTRPPEFVPVEWGKK